MQTIQNLLPGFSGLLCEENINDCQPKPCHHGVCRDGIATFSCECEAGYTGSICNIQVQECHSNPCQNRGRCVDLVNAYQCNCLPGTTGIFVHFSKKNTEKKHKQTKTDRVLQWIQLMKVLRSSSDWQLRFLLASDILFCLFVLTPLL